MGHIAHLATNKVIYENILEVSFEAGIIICNFYQV